MPFDPPSSEELHRIQDPDALLPGEDPASTALEDAVHWIQVYGAQRFRARGDYWRERIKQLSAKQAPGTTGTTGGRG